MPGSCPQKGRGSAEKCVQKESWKRIKLAEQE